MSSIQIRVDGDTEKLLEKLKKIENIDKQGVNNALAEILRTSTLDRFESTTAPDGSGWKQSIRAAEGGKTLTKTARLKNSIQATANDIGFAVGTNTIYAATHQFGDSRTIRAKNGKYLKFQVGGVWRQAKEVTIHIPARPFLGVSQEDEQEIKATLEDALR